ncbi:hypothetical protein BGZ95_007613 [Linnemannia exigua]|uniref:Uncharacterized protein n=1 Tax=Linnemannia exigua TaxID=604196 RepID=A0AAD4D0H3_9FUNG|nr:hypothetical protein BGZ95_007613 [Linnemannia exigua]
MPATDSMQPISGPIPVPGTQREPTTPPVSDIGTLTSGSSTPTTVASPRSSVIGKSSTLPTAAAVAALHNHQREASSPSYAQNLTHHNTHHHNDRHHHHNNNANSGLRRFPSIGNTTKLNNENSTLRAKIVELERYLTGLKEELILAHRQIHAQRAEIKNSSEKKALEMLDLTEKVLGFEAELKARTEECDGLRAQLQARGKEAEEEGKRTVPKKSAEVTGPTTTATVSTEPTKTESSNSDSSSSVDLDRIKALEETNAQKDAQIKELLAKVERLGTEVLNLERDKARLERPPTPEPATAATATPAPVAAATVLPTSTTLDSIVPITAAAIIAATTPLSTSVPATSSRDCGLKESLSSNSLKSSSTSPSTVGSDLDNQLASSISSSTSALAVALTVNSVGYNFAVEHPKLLAKFQALRMQHAQASEYVDSLESENRELKVQLLDVSIGSALVA